MMKPELADTWPVFRIDNPDVKGLLGLPGEPNLEQKHDGKHFTWLEIQPKLAALEQEEERAVAVEASHRRPYDQALIKLWNGQALYNHLKNTLGPASRGDLDADFKAYTGENKLAARTA